MIQYIKTTSNERIDLGSNEIDVDTLKKAISEHCSQNNIKEIVITRSILGNVGAEYVAGLVTKHKSLEILHLSAASNKGKGRIGASGAALIAISLILNKSVHTVNLNLNNIGDKGATCFAEALSVSGIKKLSLDFNGIWSKGITNLAVGLEKNTTLTSLSLEGNFAGAIGAKAIGKMIKLNNTLRNFDLSKNNIGGKGVCHLASPLMNNIVLESVRLSDNHIGTVGAEAIAEIMKVNNTLKWIDISLNHVGLTHLDGCRAAHVLSLAIKENTKLTSLDLSGNDFDAEGLKQIADGTDANRSLEILELDVATSPSEALSLQRIQINLRNNSRVKEGEQPLSTSAASTKLFARVFIDTDTIFKDTSVKRAKISPGPLLRI